MAHRPPHLGAVAVVGERCRGDGKRDQLSVGGELRIRQRLERQEIVNGDRLRGLCGDSIGGEKGQDGMGEALTGGT